MPKFAAIDVGSNAMRLSIVDAESAHVVKELLSERASVRLGADVFSTGKLSTRTISLACEALREFRGKLDQYRVHGYQAVATSAVREAENGQLLVERARREAGIELDVIEGVEEARLVRLAIVSRLRLQERRVLLIDLGGGSTEISLLERGQLVTSSSLPLGTVRLLETFFRHEALANGLSTTLGRELIERQLLEVASTIGHGAFDVVIGTGGNFETLATLCADQDASMVAGQQFQQPVPAISVAALRTIFPKLSILSADERKLLYTLRTDRADVIVPAAEIIMVIAQAWNIDRIWAPPIGLKDGVLEELIEKHFDVWDYGSETRGSIESALRLGRRFQFDEAHGRRVEKLSLELFDQLKPIHRLHERDRFILQTSAILHDIGDFIRYEGHHRHSYYLIMNSDIVGVSPRERQVIANVARYHRKSPPDMSHSNFRDLDRDERGRVRELAAILRLADALDREHMGKVTQVRTSIEKGRLSLQLTGAPDRELEEWTVLRKAEMFRDVFDLQVEISRKATG